VAGSFDGSVHQGGLDIFLAKYDPAGTRLWFTQAGTASSDWARGVATAADGVTFLSGITLGPLGENTNQGDSDVFAMKFGPEPRRRH
jgi:hypothetical protein